MAAVKRVTVTREVEFDRGEADDWPDLAYSVALMLRPHAVVVTYVQREGAWALTSLAVRGNRFKRMRNGEEAKHGPGSIMFSHRSHPFVFNEFIERGKTEEVGQ